jgi:acyl-CoA synthetase (AMP-forming)/AMP-acid ligase II
MMGEPLPRNAAGKFLKRELREQIVNGTLKADQR